MTTNRDDIWRPSRGESVWLVITREYVIKERTASGKNTACNVGVVYEAHAYADERFSFVSRKYAFRHHIDAVRFMFGRLVEKRDQVDVYSNKLTEKLLVLQTEITNYEQKDNS